MGLDEHSAFIFVAWGKKIHIIDDNLQLCCGKKPKVDTPIFNGEINKDDICKTCWLNRPLDAADVTWSSLDFNDMIITHAVIDFWQ